MTYQNYEVPEDTTGYKNPGIKNYREHFLKSEKCKKPAILLVELACLSLGSYNFWAHFWAQTSSRIHSPNVYATSTASEVSSTSMSAINEFYRFNGTASNGWEFGITVAVLVAALLVNVVLIVRERRKSGK